MKALRSPALACLLVLAVLAPVTAQVWTNLKLPPSASPPERTDHEMAYDAARKEVVLFGGRDGPTLFADTWLWNGKRWRKASPTTSPSPRRNHAMAYDPVRQVVVLYGGDRAGAGKLQDTWEWNGQQWKLVCPPPCPPSVRSSHAMAYDSVLRQVLLFGDSNRQETWAWNGRTWTQVSSSGPPLQRWEFRLVLDPARRHIVLFGGERPGRVVQDTWEWDGRAWAQKCATCGPPARQAYGMAFDGSRVVLFGGAGTSTALADTWQWDGTRWARCFPKVSPSARAGHAMVYDSARGRIVLFGGGPTAAPLADTWELGPILTGTGTARIGTCVKLALNAGPCDGGLVYRVASSLGTGPIPLGRRRIDLSPDALFFVSLFGWDAGTLFKKYAGTLLADGTGASVVCIPNLPVLVGRGIHTAFVTLSGSAPSGIKSISSTFSFRIQP